MKTARDLAREWQVGVSTVYEAHARGENCGRTMRVYETLGYWRSADPKYRSDGTPNVVRHAECSAPWLIRQIGLHDHAVQDQHGDWPWV